LSADAEAELMSERPDPRPAMRPDDSRARAAARAQELREHGGLDNDGTDEFHIDPNAIPDGWTYEWKRHSTYGKEDPSYQVALAQQGWTAVDASKHPELMPKEGVHRTIERKGMILMERPTEIVEDAKRRDLRKARQQVQVKEDQLNSAPNGTLPRDEDSRTRARVNKSYERMEIPE